MFLVLRDNLFLSYALLCETLSLKIKFFNTVFHITSILFFIYLVGDFFLHNNHSPVWLLM
jgi:hypothetical protein